MNKKLFLGMFATAALFATSCSQEEFVTPNNNDNEVMAEFTIEAPVEAIQSRTIGDGTTVDKVVCAVFEDEAGSEKAEIEGLRQTLDIVGKKATFKTRLVKGQSYRIAFFAYNEAAAAYDITDLKNIKVDMERAANDEGRDAFTAYTVVSAQETTTAINRTIELYRPFAQLNFGSYKEDIEAAEAAGIVVKTTQVTVDNVYTAFSAYDDAVIPGKTTSMTFTWADQPTEALYVENAEYDYLAMNYLLVGDKGEKALTNVVFQWTAENNKTNEPVAEFGNVPVQRNYRTNILGYLLTNPAEFNIVIDEKFETPDYVLEDTELDLLKDPATGAYKLGNEADMLTFAAALNNGTVTEGTFELAGDITLTQTWTPINTWASEVPGNIVLDGKGYSIKGLNVEGANGTALFGTNSHDLTVKNITFDSPVVVASSSRAAVVVGYSYGDIVLENVVVSNADIKSTNALGISVAGLVAYCATNDGGTLTLEGCKVEGSRLEGYHTIAGLATAPVAENITMNNCVSNNNTLIHRDIRPAAFKGQPCNNFVGSTGYKELAVAGANNTTEGNVLSAVVEGLGYVNDAWELSSAAAMNWFANEVNVNKNNFAGVTVKLASDIDLAGAAWTPVGQTGATEFKGVFDGQNYTISNLTIDSSAQTGATYSSGLFGWVESHGAEGVTIKNVKVDGATVKGHHNVAVIVGYVYGTVDNCHVTNATLECTHANDDACGDKCGTIAGYVGEDATISNCTADQVTISAGRDAGAIAGAAKPACVVNCSATNVTATAAAGCNHSNAGGNISNDVIGRVL